MAIHLCHIISSVQSIPLIPYYIALSFVDILPLAITKKRVLYQLLAFELYRFFWPGQSCRSLNVSGRDSPVSDCFMLNAIDFHISPIKQRRGIPILHIKVWTVHLTMFTGRSLH
jgi:hypothetical protein